MLRTRLIVGTTLAALAAGTLLLDRHLAPWFPFLFAVVFGLSVFGTIELLQLLPPARRPRPAVCLAGVVALILLNWLPVAGANVPGGLALVANGFAAFVLVAFLAEMAAFTGPGGAVERIALAVWLVAYLGLLPCFLVQLQLGRSDGDPVRGAVALALAIFVPKGCDIGAYFTGRLFGRHRMTPVLSPTKTWEGAAGGLALAVGVAFTLNMVEPIIPAGAAGVIAFGLTVGVAGMLGDLAESLIKRDCQRKDASQIVPGFGGILDVVDAILFAAPVSYWWLH